MFPCVHKISPESIFWNIFTELKRIFFYDKEKENNSDIAYLYLYIYTIYTIPIYMLHTLPNIFTEKNEKEEFFLKTKRNNHKGNVK